MALRPPVFRPPHQRSIREKRRDDDARRGTAQERGYDSVWSKLAKAHRIAEPLCRRCWADGVVTLGQMVDHIVRIEEAPELRLVDANLQTLCRDCHKEKTYGEDMAGHAVGKPLWLKPSKVPLTIVCGPPASGKSSWVQAQRGRDDLVLDLDVIACDVAGIPFTHAWDRVHLQAALHARNRMLGRLSKAGRDWPRAWLIVGEPTPAGRQWWADTLKPDRIVVLETPAPVCLQRAANDHDRQRRLPALQHAVGAWWDAYDRRDDEQRVIVRS